ncbi:glycosyltransferase family protein [Flavihumibacter fluvii]|uniref:glycosyltransferase family protein n=1 Tax=Flavihumibacter fluvii TaxID=2838157 RepID=UPI001BDF5F39|nr:glycosyltransferase family protein [Flavihumibacter fluvii]ULQ51440.1 glycosyl transferase [Flavihumibacter fluvii]
MKIFYAVQATGNGHISRAIQLLPYLQRYGKVDIFLSGANSQLQSELPVRFRSKGLSLFYNNTGGLQYKKLATQLQPYRWWKEVRDLPVEKYDVVINDFECVTSLACAWKKVPSVNFGHQASFQSPFVPRPARKDFMGEFLLKSYAKASHYVGLHFDAYDDFIYTPVIKKEVLQANPRNLGHFTVYLSAFGDDFLLKHLHQVPSFRFELFSKSAKQVTRSGNVTLIPVNQQRFNESMINAYGLITGAGFETPAEVMHLGKRLLVIPIKGQYEQLCNAAALEGLGVTVLKEIDDQFPNRLLNWIALGKVVTKQYSNNIPEVLDYLMETYPKKGISLDLLYPEMMLG